MKLVAMSTIGAEDLDWVEPDDDSAMQDAIHRALTTEWEPTDCQCPRSEPHTSHAWGEDFWCPGHGDVVSGVMMRETTKEALVSDLFSVREVDGRYEVLTTIEDPGHIETWEPLATMIVRHNPLEKPDGQIIPISLSDALQAEGWSPPWERVESDLAHLVVEMAEALVAIADAGDGWMPPNVDFLLARAKSLGWSEPL